MDRVVYLIGILGLAIANPAVPPARSDLCIGLIATQVVLLAGYLRASYRAGHWKIKQKQSHDQHTAV